MRLLADARMPQHGEKVSAWVDLQPYPLPVSWDMHQALEIEVLLSGRHDRYFEGLVLSQSPGDVALSASWEPHGWQTTAPETSLLVVFFLPEFLGDESLGSIPWLSLFATAPDERPKVTSEEMRQRVLAVAAEMNREIQVRDREWETAIRLGVLRLLFILARKWQPPSVVQGQAPARLSDLARVLPAISLVHERGGRPVRVGEGAAACSLSVSRFSVLFRRSLGVNYGKYVLRSRLAYAAQALLTADDPIDAIARELEFADGSHLHHAFMKHYGCTPRQYRERQRPPSSDDLRRAQ